GNNGRSRWQHKSERHTRKAFLSGTAHDSGYTVRSPQRIRERRPLSPADTRALPFLLNRTRACRSQLYYLANAGAQETSLILYAYLPAGQKIGDGCHHLCAAARAGTNRQDQITEREPSAWSDNLAKLAISLHTLAVSAPSRCHASVHCEYVVHGYCVQLFTSYAP